LPGPLDDQRGERDGRRCVSAEWLAEQLAADELRTLLGDERQVDLVGDDVRVLAAMSVRDARQGQLEKAVLTEQSRKGLGLAAC